MNLKLPPSPMSAFHSVPDSCYNAVFLTGSHQSPKVGCPVPYSPPFSVAQSVPYPLSLVPLLFCSHTSFTPTSQ